MYCIGCATGPGGAAGPPPGARPARTSHCCPKTCCCYPTCWCCCLTLFFTLINFTVISLVLFHCVCCCSCRCCCCFCWSRNFMLKSTQHSVSIHGDKNQPYNHTPVPTADLLISFIYMYHFVIEVIFFPSSLLLSRPSLQIANIKLITRIIFCWDIVEKDFWKHITFLHLILQIQ